MCYSFFYNLDGVLMRKIIYICMSMLFITYLYSESDLSLKLNQDFILHSVDNETPLFIKSNKWGRVTNDFAQSISTVSLEKGFKYKDLNVTIGSDVSFILSENPTFLVNEFFLGLDYYFLSMTLGKKKQTMGDTPLELSSGSMTVSNNASPIPKINIGIFNYFTIPYTFNILQVKGNLAHGWLQGDRSVDDILLHEKSLYFRLDSQIGLLPYGGLVHESLWYGKPVSGMYKDQYLSDLSLKNYIIIFRARSGEEDATYEGDQLNKLGNHLGAWEYGLYGNFEMVDFQFYYQHFFEDGSGMEYQNEYDGLWGVLFKPYFVDFIDNLLFEFLTTKFQSGELHDKDGIVLGGRDSYYSHGIYLNGWTHLNNILGNSFFSASGEDEDLLVSNNRMEIFHLGINGSLTDRIDYNLKGAYANYYPAYALASLYSEKTTMIHLYMDLSMKDIFINDLDVTWGVSYDFGDSKNVFGSILSFEWKL